MDELKARYKYIQTELAKLEVKIKAFLSTDIKLYVYYGQKMDQPGFWDKTFKFSADAHRRREARLEKQDRQLKAQLAQVMEQARVKHGVSLESQVVY